MKTDIRTAILDVISNNPRIKQKQKKKNTILSPLFVGVCLSESHSTRQFIKGSDSYICFGQTVDVLDINNDGTYSVIANGDDTIHTFPQFAVIEMNRLREYPHYHELRTQTNEWDETCLVEVFKNLVRIPKVKFTKKKIKESIVQEKIKSTREKISKALSKLT